ncbi:MAG: helix-turn-helix transcriptional regulator [Phycisphaeraceae bacterium]
MPPRHVQLRELCAIYRLIARCAECGRDPQQWRSQMVLGLRPLVTAQAVCAGELADADGSSPRVVQLIEHADTGPAPAGRGFGDELARNATFVNLARVPGRLVTRTRQQAEASGEATPPGLAQPGEMVDWVASLHHVGDAAGVAGAGVAGVVSFVTLHRAAGEPPFGRREHRLLHWLHYEMGRMLGTSLALARDQVALPPRLADVLACLTDGDSEKQIATRLKLSPHTVHTYVRRLYQRFAVQSRGELLARCRGAVLIRDAPAPTPGEK